MYPLPEWNFVAADDLDSLNNGFRGSHREGAGKADLVGRGLTKLNRVNSNAGAGDFVINSFRELGEQSSKLYLAAPYFTAEELILEAIDDGKTVKLLVGLNGATSPRALKTVHGKQGVMIRYLTHRFHAKIYLFDDAALLGSSNLTNGGLTSNREAVIRLDRVEDTEAVEEVRSLFVELWDAGQVLTKTKLDAFGAAHSGVIKQRLKAESVIERAVGRVEPPNIRVGSEKKSKERMFLDRLQREVYEQYGRSFEEVRSILEENNFRRPDLGDLSATNETNRFLNFVRLTYVIGDDAWRGAPELDRADREAKIVRLGREWVDAVDNKVPEDFVAWLSNVERIFGSAEAIDSASKNLITEGLMSLHAFTEQSRFVRGGWDNLPDEFWRQNNNDVGRVKSKLSNLLYGSGDYVERLHDTLYDTYWKLGRFSYFSALELYGTVKPEECPPLNGRMAKALRYLGFRVKGA